MQLQRQLDQFRSTQSRRTKLPESMWQAAVELARQHGVYSVAQPLRLDYMGLKNSKEQLGGYYIIDVGDLDVALSWAARCPAAGHGTVEVRPLWGTSGDASEAVRGSDRRKL